MQPPNSQRTTDPFAQQKKRKWQLVLSAGWVRLIFATYAVAVAPVVFKGMTSVLVTAGVYCGVALLFNLLIHRRLAKSSLRSYMMGVADILFLTYLAQLMGSTMTILPCVYLLIPVINAVSSGPRVSFSLAFTGSFVYCAILLVEFLGILPFASANLPGNPGQLPEPMLFVSSGVVVVGSVMITTVLVNRLLAALHQANERLKVLSRRDELTDLFNRRYFLERIGEELELVKRGGNTVLLMIDLDGFKGVNDELGHHAGDTLLQAISKVLSKATRRMDFVARYGGDEFVVVLRDTCLRDSAPIIERITEQIKAISADLYPSVPVTASIGVVEARQNDNAESLIRRADEKAYAAKRAGGDRSVLESASAT